MPVGSNGKPGRAPPQIGDHNLRVTLEAIRRDGPLTRLELGRRSGLTSPGITNILRRLGEDGLITARKRLEPGSGQPSTEFAVNPDGAFGVGIRLDGEVGQAVVLDLGGRIRGRRSFAGAVDAGVAVRALLLELQQSGVTSPRLLGVGVGVDESGSAPPPELQAELRPLKVTVERDCVAALLAERTFGMGAVDGGMMLILIKDRIRAGLLLRGVPFSGVHGRAGSIGSMRTGADHVPLDSVAGLGTLRQLLSEKERACIDSGGDLDLTEVIRGWIHVAAGHLLDAIVATAGFLAPSAILIGGDLPRHLVNELIAQMSVERGDTAIRPFITPWISPIRAASFPNGGIALGAALLPFFDQLLPSPMATA